MAKSYNRYEYETSPKKLEPYYAPNQKKVKTKAKNEKKSSKNTKKQKETRKLKLKIMLYLAVGFTILFAISYRNAKIDENFDKVQTLKSELVAIEKENAQLEVNMENSLNLNNIEKAAKEKLGMQKLDESQKVYVSLPKEDYVEPASEQVIVEENTNWFTNLINKIFGK